VVLVLCVVDLRERGFRTRVRRLREGGRHTGLGAAASSFCFFASGALVPVLPYLFGLQGLTAVIVAAVLVGAALLSTGVVVGLLSGGPPLRRALRQLMIGYGAASVTYLLGLLFGAGMG